MKSLKLSVLMFLVGTASVMAQGLQPIPMDSTIRYGKLSNGLTYYIRHNEQPKQRAEFYIAQNVGAILEEDNQNGLAHFLEHMCFNGTKHYPGKTFLNYFESIGVKFGQNINAYTSLDETVYNLSEVPVTREGIIDSALLILHDWSNSVSLEGKEIDQERGVIREEWRQGMDAGRRLWIKSWGVTFAGSPYAKRSIIGDTAVINNFTYETLRNYYKKWYRPDLQAILVVGDVDVDQIEAKIKTLFGSIPAPVNPAERTFFPVPDNEQPIVGVFTDPEMTSTEISLYYKSQAIPDQYKLSVQGYSVRLIFKLMGMMLRERLEAIQQEPNAPFTSASAYVGEYVRTMNAFSFDCTPVLGKEKEARERLLKEAEIVRRFGFTETELERAKAEMLSNYEKAYKERNQQKNNTLVREYTRNFTQADPCPGIEWELNFIKENFPSLTAKAINQLAGMFLTEKNIVYTMTGPEKEGLVYPTNEELLQELAAARKADVQAYKDSVSNEPLIAQLPKAGKVKKTIANTEFGTTEWILSNGIRVIVKPTKFKEDEIRMSAWSKGGNSQIATEDLPSAAFSTGVITQSGVGHFNLNELNKKLSGKIASVTPQISNYEEGLRGSSSVKDLETMLQLNYLYLTAPREDQNAFDLVMKSVKTYLENAELNPEKAFNDSVDWISYGGNPRITLMNLENYNKVQYPAVLRVYRERFANPADFTFAFVGNIDLATFKPLIEQYLGGLKTTKKLENWKDNGLRITKGQLHREIVKKLQTQKTSNFIRYSAEMPYTLNNKLAISALADILDLRYTEEIREKEGATYGVQTSGFSTNKSIEITNLIIQFDTDPKLEERMRGLIHAQIKSIAENGPKPEDLNKVKLNLIKQYKEDVAENGWWMGTIKSYDQDKMNYVSEYEKAVENLTSETISALVKELLKQGNIQEILLQPEETK
jgi:zinc protease